MRALAVGDHLLVARDHRISVFAARGRARCMVVRLCVDWHSQCQPTRQRATRQRAAALQELPAASSIRTHRFLLRNDTTESRPRGREYTRPCQIWPALMSRGLAQALRAFAQDLARPGLGPITTWPDKASRHSPRITGACASARRLRMSSAAMSTARALPPVHVEQGGQNWTPIGGQVAD